MTVAVGSFSRQRVILRVLAQKDDRGLTLAELAKAASCSLVQATDAVTRLVAKGWVKGHGAKVMLVKDQSMKAEITYRVTAAGSGVYARRRRRGTWDDDGWADVVFALIAGVVEGIASSIAD